jgi:transposase
LRNNNAGVKFGNPIGPPLGDFDGLVRDRSCACLMARAIECIAQISEKPRLDFEAVAYAGLNPRQHQSGTSIDRVTRISKIGNAVLRAALYMPAMSAMRYNPAIVALVARLKSRGRLKPKQILVAATRKLLVLCFGVLKTGKPFDPAIAMGC